MLACRMRAIASICLFYQIEIPNHLQSQAAFARYRSSSPVAGSRSSFLATPDSGGRFQCLVVLMLEPFSPSLGLERVSNLHIARNVPRDILDTLQHCSQLEQSKVYPLCFRLYAGRLNYELCKPSRFACSLHKHEPSIFQ
jgi:hypothetical protein